MQINPFANPSVAGKGYANALSVAQPDPAAGRSPAAAFQATAADFLETVRVGEATAMAGVAGRADAQAVVQALAQTEIAMQTAVAVRDKVVEAYQEILRMPV